MAPVPSPAAIDLCFNPQARRAGTGGARYADYKAATTLGSFWVLHDAHCRALLDEALEHCSSWHLDLEHDMLLRNVDSAELNRLNADAPASRIAASIRVAALHAASYISPPRLPGRAAGRGWPGDAH